MKIPLCKPFLEKDEYEAVRAVLESGWLAHGPRGKEFEESFAKYIGTKRAVTLNSCTSALHLAMQAQGLKGDIIVPSFTFSASANSIVTAGCKPVFAEILPDTYNIDPEDIRKKITSKTVGIMPVHYAGLPCQMDAIMEIAEKHNLKVIEDSAETIGGEFKGKKTGSFGTGCFSFFPTKNIATGEGGMVTTDDVELARNVEAYKGHGMYSDTWAREKSERPWYRASSVAGYNFRMCDILAAIGVVQMKKLDRMNELRRKHASVLTKGLSGIAGVSTPVESENTKHVYQMYVIRLDTGRISRLNFVKSMRELGVEVNVHFDPPVHLQPYYLSSKAKLPVTESVASSVVTLPIYPQMTNEEVDYVISSVHSVVKKLAKA